MAYPPKLLKPRMDSGIITASDTGSGSAIGQRTVQLLRRVVRERCAKAGLLPLPPMLPWSPTCGIMAAHRRAILISRQGRVPRGGQPAGLT